MEEKQEAPVQEPNKEQLYLDQLQRLQAEFINFRNRIEKEKATIIDQTKDILLCKFLEVKDNFERIPKQDQGVVLIYKQLNKIFEEEQVQELTINLGNPESFETIATNDQSSDIEITQKGYTRNGKIMRPVQIILGTKESHEKTEDKTSHTI